MGYDVHITRKNDWFEDGGPEISLDDWLRYVSGDPEMRADGFAEAQTPDGSTIRVENPGIAVWVAYSGRELGGNMAWFSHSRDRVTVKNPDEEILVKMHQIALALDARVEGDEGEEYGEDGKSADGELEHRLRVDERRRPWWKFWRDS